MKKTVESRDIRLFLTRSMERHAGHEKKTKKLLLWIDSKKAELTFFEHIFSFHIFTLENMNFRHI